MAAVPSKRGVIEYEQDDKENINHDQCETDQIQPPKRMKQCIEDVAEEADVEQEILPEDQYPSDVEDHVSTDIWKRPAVPFINARKQSVCMQTTSIVVEFCPSGPNKYDWQTRIRLFGVNDLGNSVMFDIVNFHPYFYVGGWDGFNTIDAQALKDIIDTGIQEQTGKNHKYVHDCVADQRQTIWQYNFDRYDPFIKIMMNNPRDIQKAVKVLKSQSYPINGTTRRFTTYESFMPPELRYMCDKGIKMWSWVEAPPGKYIISNEEDRVSTSQLEVQIDWNHVVAHEAVGEWMRTAPIRTLSWDIECLGRPGVFPEAETDSVICIGAVLNVLGRPEMTHNAMFISKVCDPITGLDIRTGQTESEMLSKWHEYYTEEADPDVDLGWNTAGFDRPYVTTRNEVLDVTYGNEVGRIKGKISRTREMVRGNKQTLRYKTKETPIDGRIQMDACVIVRKEHKLRSYKLNAVADHFLKQTKDDVSYKEISGLFETNSTTRKRLAMYCWKDAKLPVELMNKLQLLVNHGEMARVVGVPIDYLLNKGQQIRVVSQLVRHCLKKKERFLLPDVERSQNHGSDEVTFEGATVIEPKKGFYKLPIATLDFASLYPSIMRAQNLCYSTLLKPGDEKLLKPEDYTITPNGDMFVKPHIRKGVCAEVLEDLINSRAATRKEMKGLPFDSLLYMVLNGRQLATKTSANSVYGFTGAVNDGFLPCMAISASVTAFGRQMIEKVSSFVEEYYTIKNGYKHNAEVVYGDTDSVMIKFGVETVAEAMDMGMEASVRVSQLFIAPIKLEFEKVLCIGQGTLISCADGTSVPIEKMEHCPDVLTYDRQRQKLICATTAAHLVQGTKECIELLFHDGRTLVCTPDHQIMGDSGKWIEAQHLVRGESFVKAGVDYPHIDGLSGPEDDEFCLPVPQLGFSLDMKQYKAHTLAFVRLLGLLMTDGHINMTRNDKIENIAEVYVSSLLDRQRVLNDIHLLTNCVPKASKNSHMNNYRISLPVALTRSFVCLGAPVGGRMRDTFKPNLLPAFLTSTSCPLAVVSQFLAGLFSGDGCSPLPTYLQNGKALVTPIKFVSTRLGRVIFDQMDLYKQIQQLLERLGVSVREIRCTAGHNGDGFTDTGRLRIKRLKIDRQQLTNTVDLSQEQVDPATKYHLVLTLKCSSTYSFNNKVGFVYCMHKQQRLSALAGYYRLANQVTIQKREVYNRVQQLTGFDSVEQVNGRRQLLMPLKQALVQALHEVGSRLHLHPAVNNYHLGTLKAQLQGTNTVPGDGEDCYPPLTLDEYLNLTDCKKFFSEGRPVRYNHLNPNSPVEGTSSTVHYATDQSDELPTFRLQLLSVRSVGIRPVYDISVPSHVSFVANGTVVHNCPMLLLNKKKYAGMYWTNPVKADKMDAKGIETVRRDWCRMVSEVCEKCLNLLMDTRDENTAVEYVKSVIKDLYLNKVDMYLLILSKGYNKEDYKAKQPHVELAKRMMARDPTTAPVLGDRIDYVMVLGAKNAKAADMAEDPRYVVEHDLPICTEYYIEKQLRGPLERIFGPVIGEQRTSEMFAGSHTMHRKIVTSSAKGSISSFFTKTRTCASCRHPVVLQPGQKSGQEHALCNNCRSSTGELTIKASIQAAELQLEQRKWLDKCRACTSIPTDHIMCDSTDCATFWRRDKLSKDIKSISSQLLSLSF